MGLALAMAATWPNKLGGKEEKRPAQTWADSSENAEEMEETSQSAKKEKRSKSFFFFMTSACAVVPAQL